MPARLWLVALPLVFLAACAERPEAAGVVAGVVRWSGDVPAVAPFRSPEEPLSDKPDAARDWPNPNAPRVGEAGGVRGAVVYLRGVDPHAARRWHHPPARAELRGQRYALEQGGPVDVAFVRAGDEIEFVSRDDRLHVARARGAAFFSLTLPRPGEARKRRLATPGVVELTSGTGYFWMRAYAHVAEHPYLARTDAQGRYRLEQVPPGEYEVVAWHPDWRVERQERNPDLFRVQQVRFGSPLEASRTARVGAGEVAVDLALGGR